MTTTVFIFAHQDDEIAVFHALRSIVRSGGRAVCIYLTNGEFGGVGAAIRNRETLGVLRGLGVAEADIHFTGDTTGIKSGELSAHVGRAAAILSPLLDRIRPDRLVTHAWEGGHEDHDAACWITVWQAIRLEMTEPVRQVGLYTRKGQFGLGYRAFVAIKENGPSELDPIPLRDRLAFCRLLFRYRSQTKTMIGLGPFFAWKTLLRGVQEFQTITRERLDQRPHAGILLYESRNRGDFERNLACYRKQLPMAG